MRRVALLLLVIYNLTYAYDRRLQNANLDFINFEAQNRKPTQQPQFINQNDPAKLNPNLVTSTTTKSSVPNQPKDLPKSSVQATVSTTTKPPIQTPPKPIGATATVSGVKPTTASPTNVRQLIKNYNDRGTTESPKPLSSNNRNSPQSNKQNANFPTPPKTGAQVNPQPNSGASWASIAAGRGPTLAPKPQSAPSSPTAVKPPVIPGSPNPMNSQGASGQSGGGKPNVATPGVSWASVAGGKNTPDTNKPQVVPGSPGLVKPQVTPGLPTSTSNVPSKTTPKPGESKTTDQGEIATDKELSDLSEALLSKDVNNPSKYITLNIQRKTTSFSKDDLASEPLFTIDPEVWKISTIAAMKTLLDNYEQDTTVNEYVTPQEKNEENAFLDAIMATSVMRHLMTFLKEKGIVTPDPKQQRDVLKQTWFNMYSRGQGKIGSSGFEHIFLSEIKNNEISGLHNWLYFHTEEAAQRANYLGYLKKVDFGNKGNILKLHFSMKGIDKPVDTMFVGTSPELEMALYSLCFYTRADKSCPLSLGGQQFNLRTHNFRYRSKNMIGSAFPEI